MTKRKKPVQIKIYRLSKKSTQNETEMTSKIAAASARAKEKIHEIQEKTETASFIKLKDKVSFVLGKPTLVVNQSSLN